jgi:hypothetical protein
LEYQAYGRTLGLGWLLLCGCRDEGRDENDAGDEQESKTPIHIDSPII